MKKIVIFLGGCIIVSFVLASCSKGNDKIIEKGESLFFDDFEAGDLSKTENNIYYGASTSTEVSSEMKKDGTYSLKFSYSGVPGGEDSFAEQRMSYPNTEELWIKYDLYIPANYYHRKESGASNNKFLAVYKNEYTQPGFQVNWSLSPNETGGSNLTLHRYRNGEEQSTISPSGGIGDNFLTENDHGKWINITARVKAPGSEGATDGIMQMWKDGILVCDETELDMFGGVGENFMNELYLLGWSNSGFTENTNFYIDNLRLNFSTF